MSTAITKPAGSNGLAPSVAGLTPDQWQVLKQSICKGFTDTEAQVFAFRCQALGLSPLSGQITAFKQGGSGQGSGVIPIVTIDGYRSIAASVDPGYVVEVEYLVGNEWVDWIPEEPASQCRARVWRTGAARPVSKAVSRKEFAGNGNPWRSMPNHMLAKVAESHALRMAYPQTLAGTYSTDEMVNAKTEVTDITPPEPVIEAKLPPAKAAATASDAQLQKLATAMNRVLTDVGREAFLVNIQQGFGIETLNQLPAEQFEVVMRTLADKGRVQAWNMARDGNGNVLLTEERIAELEALSSDRPKETP